jgi:peptidase M42 family hydrolase
VSTPASPPRPEGTGPSPDGGGTVPAVAALPDIDMDWTLDLLLRLLRTPSPSGRTDAVVQLLGDELAELPVDLELTRRGSLLARLPGTNPGARAIVCHADTIGCMVSDLKPNGRLAVVPVGTHSARFAEGCRVTVLTDDPDRTYTGTILPLLASGHAFGDDVDTQPTGWQHVEVRVDEQCASAEDLAELGIRIGDFVAIDSLPIVTDSGYVNARHLDGKAGVAAALGALHALCREGSPAVPHEVHLLVTIAEEVGQGASHGLQEDVAEMLSIDNAVVAPGHHSIETGVTIPMLDATGPFDYHFTRHLCRLCETHGIPYARDVFRHYRSDVAAALSAGAETRAALVAFGVDASHGAERTHLDSIEAVARLVCAHLLSPLTFERWDRTSRGDLRDFPSGRQPAPTERFGELPTD